MYIALEPLKTPVLTDPSRNLPQFNQRITRHECEHRSCGNSSGHYRLSVNLPDATFIKLYNNG